ncbi:MAG: hypothetical protein ABSG41_09530, partial [Bryobacteraceae bacterium]
QRANQISQELATNQFLAPTALNVTQGQNGTLEDFDARGNLRTSALSAVPTVAEPYITGKRLNGAYLPTYYTSAGGVTKQFSGIPNGTGIAPVSNAPAVQNNYYTTVHANDAESFHAMLQKPAYSAAVGESLATHLQTTEGRASNAIRFVTH